MKTPPVEGWQPTTVIYPVRIPTASGREIAETIEIEIDAWQNVDGEVFLDGDAQQRIDHVKAARLQERKDAHDG